MKDKKRRNRGVRNTWKPRNMAIKIIVQICGEKGRVGERVQRQNWQHQGMDSFLDGLRSWVGQVSVARKLLLQHNEYPVNKRGH